MNELNFLKNNPIANKFKLKHSLSYIGFISKNRIFKLALNNTSLARY